MIQIWNLYSPYLMLLSAIIIVGIAVYIFLVKFLKKHADTKIYTILLFAFNGVWIILNYINMTNSGIVVKGICTYGIAFMQIFIPVHWLFYTFRSALKKINLKTLYNSILSLLLFAGIVFISTNAFHHQLWRFNGMQQINGIGFFVIYLVTLNLIVIGGIFLIKNLSFPFYIFRWQALAIFIATSLPFILIVLENILNIYPAAPVILLPYGFVISAWIIRLTKTRYSSRDIIAVSRASFFENINDAIVVLDKHDIIIDINPVAKLLIKQEAWAVLEKPIILVWPELAEYLIRYNMGNEKNNYVSFEYNNKQHFYDIEISPFIDWEGSLISKIIVLHDITERKIAEDNLRKSEEKFRSLIKQSIDGIVIIDEFGYVVEWNDGMEKITGIFKESVINKKGWDIFAKYLNTNFNQAIEIVNIKNNMLNTIETGTAPWLNKMAEYTINHPDGSIRTIQQQTFLIKTSKGNSLGSIIRDITVSKQLESERIKTGKLESLGILAGGIAHDFNNILTAIFGNLSMAKISGNNEKLSKLLLDAEAACLQAKNLTLQLLTFSKGGEPIRKTTSIVDIVKNAASFSLRGSNVHYEIINDAETWPVDVDIGQMNQVISNLIINADQAMHEGGIIKICINNVHMEENEFFPLKTGKYIKINITDTGTGIPEQNLSKIFDPYFTTKEKGNGLGLAITYNIIKRHNGYLSVESSVGVGTTFSIYLKASDQEIIPEEVSKPEVPQNTLKLKILIMDDEHSVRTILKQMLELIGHSSVCTAEGNEAIIVYKTALNSQEPFDIVIMDLTVPGGMGGKDTITKLLEIDIEAKAIVSSGYSNDPILANYKKYGFKGFLPKPYRLSELENVINSVIAG